MASPGRPAEQRSRKKKGSKKKTDVSAEAPMETSLEMMAFDLSTAKTFTFGCKENAPISQVTVYSSAAEISRILSFSGTTGSFSQVIITGIPEDVDPNTISVSHSEGKAVILEVRPSNETRYALETKNSIDEKALMDEIKTKNILLDAKKTQLGMLERYEESIVGIPLKKQDDQTVNLLQDSSIENFFNFLERSSSSILDITNQIDEITRQIADLQLILDVSRSASVPVVSAENSISVEVDLFHLSADSVNLKISYLINKAAWTPSYDIRVTTNSEGSFEVSYYGVVSQRTQEDWTNVRLVLSTAVPHFGGVAPTLKTATLSIKPKHVIRPSARRRESRECLEDAECEKSKDMKIMKKKTSSKPSKSAAPMAVMTAEVETGTMATSFNIPRAATIKSDESNPHKVTIGIISLEPSFIYYISPKASTHAFLEATAKNTSAFPFLEGNANVFLENSFICTTRITSVSPMETVKIYLGVDDAIRVETSVPKQKLSSQGVISKTNGTHVSHLTTITNTKPVPILAKIIDQIPISKQDEVRVRLLEPNVEASPNVSLEKINNHIVWDLSLASGESHKIALSYEIEFPKKAAISLVDEAA